MSELERLNKAIEWVERQIEETGMQPWPLVYLGPILDASRAYRDLLANGRRVEWCETHRREAPATAHCDSSQHIAMEPCRIVSKLLSVYPKEADE